MRDLIANQCIKSLPIFIKRVANVPWRDRSILLSEAFAFCAIGDLFNIDVVLESGVGFGRSTEIWANYFASKKVFAVDCELKNEVIIRLKHYSNLTLIKGDGSIILNDLLGRLGNFKIGIFMDGPKGERAVNFGRKVLTYNNVQFFALHDVCKIKKKARTYFKELGRNLFFTEEKWFIEKYSKIDRNESNWDESQKLRWIPFGLLKKEGNKIRNLGSYGPTIGFVFNYRNQVQKNKPYLAGLDCKWITPK